MTQLAEAIAALAKVVDQSDVDHVAKVLDSLEPGSSRTRLLEAIAQPGFRARATHLLEIWEREQPSLPGSAVALALRTAAEAAHAIQGALSVDVVWTGPKTPSVPVRRTDQVLLDLIHAAQKELWIVSYAVSRVPEVDQALKEALQRDVRVGLVFESVKESEGRLTRDRLSELARKLPRANIYVWPLEKRPQDDNERRGVLHAKCAVADSEYLLVSSANLTEYALELNMEIGLLVNGSSVAARVARHPELLVEREILCLA